MLSSFDTYLEISDRERATHARALLEAGAVTAAGGARPGARVLDAGAGQGWHALALAGRYRVAGIEPTPLLLAEGRRRASALPPTLRPLLLLASAAVLPFPDGAFELAYSLHSSIGYGTVAEDAAVLDELCRVLEPGSRLVLQTVSATSAAVTPERAERFPDGAWVLHQPAFDETTGCFSERQALVLPDGRTGTFRFAVRAYDPADLEQLAREAGFCDVRVFGSLDGKTWSEDDPAVLVARTAL